MTGTVSCGVSSADIADVLLNGKFKNIVTVAKTGRANFVCSNYVNDSACIQAATDYAKTTGIGTILILSGSYTMTNYITIDIDLDIVGIGNPSFSWSNTTVDMIQCSGTLITTVTATDALVGASTITVADATGVVEGDIILIYDDTIWNPNENDTNKFDITKTGELHEVSGVSGNTVTFYDSLLNSYTSTNNLSVKAYTPIRVNISGITINGSSSTSTNRLIGLNYCKNSSIHDCILKNGSQHAIFLNNSYGTQIFKNKISHCENSGLGYGVAVYNSSAHTSIYENDISACRHCVTCTSDYTIGQPRDTRIHDNNLYRTLSYAVDAHQITESLFVYNNIIRGKGTDSDTWALGSGAKWTEFRNNKLYDCNGTATRGSVADMIYIVEGNINTNGGYMFYDSDSGTNTEKYVSVSGNTMIDPAYFLIRVTKAVIVHVSDNYINRTTSYWAVDISNATSGEIINNRIENSYRSGANLVNCSNLKISNNNIVNPAQYGQVGELYECGIAIRGTSNNLKIENNTITDTNSKMKYGVKEYGTADYNTIKNNVISGAVTSQISKRGSSTVIKNNIGYTTENAGTATITAGQTSVSISHGLDSTPTRVLLTPTTATAGKQYYISAKAASTFTITIDSAHSADISFDWQGVA